MERYSLVVGCFMFYEYVNVTLTVCELHYKCVISCVSSTFLRGQNIHVDPTSRLEQEEKKRKYLEHQARHGCDGFGAMFQHTRNSQFIVMK